MDRSPAGIPMAVFVRTGATSVRARKRDEVYPKIAAIAARCWCEREPTGYSEPQTLDAIVRFVLAEMVEAPGFVQQIYAAMGPAKYRLGSLFTLMRSARDPAAVSVL